MTQVTTVDGLRAMRLPDIMVQLRGLVARFQPDPVQVAAGVQAVQNYDEADDVYEDASRAFTEVQRRYRVALRATHVEGGPEEVDPELELALYRSEKLHAAAYAGQARFNPPADEERVIDEKTNEREKIPAAELTPHTTQSWTPDEKADAGIQE